MSNGPNNPPPPDSPYTPESIKEALKIGYTDLRGLAKILDVTYHTARKYVAEGQIKGTKIGNKVRVYEDELLRFLRAGTNYPDPQRKNPSKKPKRDFSGA